MQGRGSLKAYDFSIDEQRFMFYKA